VNGNQIGTFGFPKKTVRHPAREVLQGAGDESFAKLESSSRPEREGTLPERCEVQGGSGWRSPTPILELSIMLATTRHVDLIRAIAGVSAIGDM
jgi:hypothetical protein